jgi:hypothetical protein
MSLRSCRPALKGYFTYRIIPSAVDEGEVDETCNAWGVEKQVHVSGSISRSMGDVAVEAAWRSCCTCGTVLLVPASTL